jgi:LemA protein
MKALLAVVAVVVVLTLILGGMYVSTKNKIVTMDEQVKSNWAQVDVVLQRRADLIPNLVETVKGFAAHEETVFGDIAKARSALLNAKTPQEKIAPQLKSNENFLRLQDELAGTENRIAVERKRYNDSVQAYNTFIRQFPNSIFATWAGFKENDAYFKASEGSREAPKVQFPAATR